jgi:LysR family transcriptional activator of mexEF-oprN operon
MNGQLRTPHLGPLQHLDLGLLRVLCTLVRLRSVSRAAAQLHLSQPAISHALARLRSLTGDALLVRQGRSMVPSAFAITLADEVEPALVQIEASLLGRSRALPPAEIDTVFRLGMSDDLQIAVLPTVLAALRAQAPKARVVVTTHHQNSAPHDLRDGKLDLVLAYLEQLPPQAKVKRVADLDYQVLRADVAAPAASAPIDLAAYCARPHLLVSFAADLHGFVDDVLAQLGSRRQVVCSTAQFGALPFLLAGTDLLATVPAHLARALSYHPGLRADPLPFASPRFPLSLCWSATSHQEPAHAWLRRLVEEACCQVLGPSAGVVSA